MRRVSGLVISKLAHHTVEGGTSCDWALQHNKVLNSTFRVLVRLGAQVLVCVAADVRVR